MASHKGQDITAYLSMDISDLKKGITEARREIESINSKFTEVAGKSKNWEHSSDLLTKKLIQLRDLIKEKIDLIGIYNAIIEKNNEKYSSNERRAEKLRQQLQYLKDAGEENSEEYERVARKLEVCEKNMVDAEVEAKRYSTTLSNTKGEVVDLRRDVEKYTDELEENRKEEERQVSTLGQLEQKIKDQESELKDLKEEYQNVALEEGKTSDAAKALAGKIDDLSGELKENKDKLNDAKVASDKFDQSLRDVDGAAETAQSGFTVLKGVIANLVTEGINKAIQGLKDLTSEAITFESSFADVRKVLGDATDEELKDLENGIRELAKIRPETASDIAQIASTAAQLGVRGTDNIIAFTDTVVKLGDATNLVGTEGAETLAKFMNISGTASEDVDRLGATIVNLGNNFATTEDDIARMALRLAGAGKQVGATEPEILGIAAALSSVGIEAEAGGSAFSKLMINMSNASAIGEKANEVIDSTGMSLRDLQMLADQDSQGFKALANDLGYTSDEFQDFIDASATLEQFSKVTGMTADEFNKAYREDAVGTIETFLSALNSMSGTDALETLNEMGIKEIRLRDAILRASGGVDQFDKALKTANTGWEENIALDNEANQRYQTTESRMKMVKNEFIDMGISLKEKFQPAIDTALEALSWIADHGELIVGILLSIAAAFVGFQVASTIMTLVSAFSALFSLIQMGVPLMQALNMTMAANPIGIIVGLIAALVAAFIYFWNTSEEFRQFWIDLWENIKSAASDAWEAISGFFKDAWAKIKAVAITVATWFNENVVEPLKEFFSPLIDFFTTLFNNIKGFAEGCWLLIKTTWSAVSTWFNDNVISPVREKFEKVWSKVSSLASDAWSAIKKVFSPVADWFKDKFSKAWENVKKVFSAGGKVFDGIKDGILEGLKSIINALIKGINKVIEIPFKGINKAIKTIKNIEILGVKPFEDKLSEFDIPQIPELRKGGILKKGQVGLLEGDGAEAVVPLDQNKAWIREVGKDMKKELGITKYNNVSNQSKSSVNNFTQNIYAPKQPSRIELYRQTRNLLNFSKGEA